MGCALKFDPDATALIHTFMPPPSFRDNFLHHRYESFMPNDGMGQQTFCFVCVMLFKTRDASYADRDFENIYVFPMGFCGIRF